MELFYANKTPELVCTCTLSSSSIGTPSVTINMILFELGLSCISFCASSKALNCIKGQSLFYKSLIFGMRKGSLGNR